jgi:hypothetical protein
MREQYWLPAPDFRLQYPKDIKGEALAWLGPAREPKKNHIPCRSDGYL